MKLEKLLSAALASALLAGLLVGCGGKKEPSPADALTEIEAQTWTISCSAEAGSAAAAAGEDFAARMEKATNGAIRVEWKKDAPGGEADLRAALTGEAQIALCSSLEAAGVDQRFSVLSLPFLFSSGDAADAALDGSGGAALGAILEEYGGHSLGVGSCGFRCPTNSLRPVASAEDLRGLRIRVEDAPILRRAYALWGAECAAADWPVVFTALQTGALDGQENLLPTADAASIQTIQKYVTYWTAFYEGLIFCMNKELYDSLAPDLQSAVDDCGRQAVEAQRASARQREDALLSSWGGRMTVTELTEQEIDAFRNAAAPCYDEFADAVTPELLAVFTGS